MAEMKNINGHSFVDEQARNDIEELKKTIDNKVGADKLNMAVENALTTAKESGEFDGPAGVSPTVTMERFSNASGSGVWITVDDADSSSECMVFDGKPGPAGADYVLTAADKQEIAGMVEGNGSLGTWGIIADVTVEDNSVAYYKFDVPDGKTEFVVLLTFVQDSEITSAVNGKMCVNSTNGPWGGDGCAVAYNIQALAYKETDLSMTYLWRFDFIDGYIVPKTRFASKNSAASRYILDANAAVGGGFELHKASDSNEVMLQQCDGIRTIEIGSHTKWFGRGSRLLIMAR